MARIVPKVLLRVPLMARIVLKLLLKVPLMAKIVPIILFKATRGPSETAPSVNFGFQSQEPVSIFLGGCRTPHMRKNIPVSIFLVGLGIPRMKRRPTSCHISGGLSDSQYKKKSYLFPYSPWPWGFPNSGPLHPFKKS